MHLLRTLTLSAALFAAALPTAALAADTEASASTGVLTGILLGLASNPEVVALLVSLAVGGGIALYRSWKKDKAEEHLRWLGRATSMAYYAVNDIALRTPNKVDDKVVAALGFFRDELARRGYVPTPTEEESAKVQWSAMHGAELTAQKLAAQGAGALATSAALSAVHAVPTGASDPRPS